ncbi:gamma-glutamylcyclotransferase family protein [Asanoa sp. NPDC049573]|uniref:gamma-glutamylcyclotransferase family protein n=1 Tax=Asanoa sp. NPDC049573 TaxID=3155396 RepID=UPI003441E35C
MNHGVFVYGSMASPAEIAGLLGKDVAVEGVDYVLASLAGWRRTWNVCTDNTTSRAVRYHTPGTKERPPVQVLFLNLEPAAEETTGYLIFVEAHHLAALDAREGNYDRVPVTDQVTPAARERPAVVWTYVGKGDRETKARAAIRRGSARIRREYLDKVVEAFGDNEAMAAELVRTKPPAPVERLDRVVGEG